MDGSEASMIPVIIRNAHHILNLKSSRYIESLPEFSVGRGVADLFIFQKDIKKSSATTKNKSGCLCWVKPPKYLKK